MRFRSNWNPIYGVILAIGLLCGTYIAAATSQQPVYIRLYAEATDHVNLDMTEDRLRHILPEVERYRKMYPEAHVSATVLFSGAVSRGLEQRNAQTHVLDFVKDYLRRGVIEAGYDGTDEPTYDQRPVLKFSQHDSPWDRWRMRQENAEKLLTEARDPLTGAPADGDGGLKKMQEVFGPAAYIKGLELAIETYRPPVKVTTDPKAPGAPVVGVNFAPRLGVFRESGGDTETLQTLRKYNSAPVMRGIPGLNPGQLPGFGGASSQFGQLMSSKPDTAPEVYWQDNVLRISESMPPVHVVEAVEGTEPLKAVLDKVNRSTAHVIQVQLGGIENYLKPEFAKTAPNAPVQYAYEHPQSPKLPGDAMRPETEIAAGWAKEDALLKWLSDNYFPKNAGSRFVSTGDLATMAGSSMGFAVSTDSLRAAVSDALQKVGNDTHLFSYLEVDGHYLSMADLYQAMTDELAEFHETGKLPASVKIVKVYGPFRLVTGHGPNEGEVTSGEIEAQCAEIARALHDETGSSGVPTNSIPPLVKMKDMNLNPAQMIRLMALALANPVPETKLPVRMSYVITGAAMLPNTRPVWDTGFIWTIKPAPLSIAR